MQELEKRRRLTDKQYDVRQKVHRTRGYAVRGRRTNNRTPWQLAAQERTRLRHNQIGSGTALRQTEQHSDRGRSSQTPQSPDRPRSAAAHSLPYPPSLKVHRFRRPNADQDPQYFHTRRPLRHRGIQAVPSLLDGRDMDSGGVRDRLQRVGVLRVGLN